MLLIGCDRTPKRDDLLSGRVTRVVSGQTIEVMLTQTSEVARVRITGIDAPDLRQSPWGKIAKDSLSDLIMDRQIELESKNSVRDGFNPTTSQTGNTGRRQYAPLSTFTLGVKLKF